VIVNLSITPEKSHRTTLLNAGLIRLMEDILFPPKRWWLSKSQLNLSCVALTAVKRAGCVGWQLECHTSNVTARVQSDHRLHGTRFQYWFTAK